MRAHGTRTKYVHDGCRCLPCRVAATNYETARQAARRLPWRVVYIPMRGEWAVMHRETHEIIERTSDRQEAHRLRDSRNEGERLPDPIWANPKTVAAVKQHLVYLQTHGVGLRRVGEVSGVSRTRLMGIIHDRSYNRNRPKRQRLRQQTAERILGVTVSEAASGACVPGSETWGLLGVLLAAGYSKAALARMLGYRRGAIQFRHAPARITARNARKVRALYEALWKADARVRQAMGDAPNDGSAAERKRFRSLERLGTR